MTGTSNAEVGRTVEGDDDNGGGDDAVQRADAIEPFLRGVAWPAGGGATYPRADPADFARLPIDTWATACVPVGVRLEIVGDATAVDIEYETATAELGYRGPGAGTTFTAWHGNTLLDEQPARGGRASVRLTLGDEDGRVVVHLPEGMKPRVTGLSGIGGNISPAPPQPRWLAYGDSIAEGWIASGPAGAWPAIVGRTRALDVVNLGYAGSARGELVSAEHIASLHADVISITHGTNCWTRIPHSVAQMEANTAAFLRVVRAGHPGVPIVVASPIVRPDGEETPNKLGATHADIRAAMERAVQATIDAGDDLITLIGGADLVPPDLLADGIHPGDAGHSALAGTLGAAIAAALPGRPSSPPNRPV